MDGGEADVPDADASDADAADGDVSDADPSDVDSGLPDATMPPDAEPVDTAQVDAQPVDTGAPDTGVTDGGIADAGIPWALTDWRRRIQLTLSNPSTRPLRADSVVRVVVDHAALTGPPAPFGPPYATPNGDDLAVVFEQTNIPRWAGGERGFNRTDTRLYFRLQRELPAGGNDSDYWLYFGNPSPMPPSTDGIPEGRIVGQRLRAGTLIQPVDTTPVPVLNIELGPSRADEQWLVMAQWRAQRTSGPEHAFGVASFTVNGVAVPEVAGASAAQNRNAPRYTSTWLLLGGSAMSQQVVLSLARNGATGAAVALDDARLTAVLLPQRSAATTSTFIPAPAFFVGANSSVTRTLPLDIGVPRYVWFGRSLFQEAPDGTGHLHSRVTTVPRIAGPSSVDYQVTDYSQSIPGAYSSLFGAREFASSDILSVNLVHATADAISGSRELGSGQFAIPTDGFEDVDSSFSRIVAQNATGTTPHTSFAPAGHPQGKLRDYVYIFSAVGDFRGDDDDVPVHFRYFRNGVDDGSETLIRDGSSAPSPIAWFWAQTTTSPPSFRLDGTTDASAMQLRNVWSRYHSHLVLRLNDPDSLPGPVETQ